MPAMEHIRDLGPLTLRTVLLFIFVLGVMRWTGKRTIGALAPFDLAVVIMMGEVAAIPIADLHVDLLHGLWPVLLLGVLHIGLAGANLRWRALEQFTEGTAALLVQDGRPVRANMVRERVSMHDLQASLRLKNVHHLADVKEAWMEHSGGISVVLKDDARPLTQGQFARLRQALAARTAAATGTGRPAAATDAGGPTVDRPAAPAGTPDMALRVQRALMNRLGLDEPATAPLPPVEPGSKGALQ